MKTTKTDINGSYKTADGKAQIDFGITYRNGHAEFTASGFYNGSSGQCIDDIAKAYPRNERLGANDPVLILHRIAAVWRECHLQHVNTLTVEKVKRWAARFPAVSFHDNQAEQFLTSNGIKFRATLSDTKAPAWIEQPKLRRCKKCDGHGVVDSKACKACKATGHVYPPTHGHHYRVTLSRQGWKPDRRKAWEKLDDSAAYITRRATNESAAENRLTFDFWGSITDADKGIKTVKPYDVLACVSGDAYTTETFAGFCREYGYESDSIKALQTFRRCSAFAKRLRAFFTSAELEQLQEIN